MKDNILAVLLAVPLLAILLKPKGAEGQLPEPNPNPEPNPDPQPNNQFDNNGILLPQPLLQEGVRLEYFNETSSFKANFRTDGRRYDFNGKRDSVILAGYWFLPENFTNDEVSAKMNGGPHNDTNPDWADTMDLGITNFTGNASRLRMEKTHPIYSSAIPPTFSQLPVGECRGKWRGYIGMKVNLDLDRDGVFDKVAIIGMVDVGGLNAQGNPVNDWRVTYKKILTPDASLKSWFTPYVCTIGQCNLAQNTMRIDNVPPDGMDHKFVTCKEIRAVNI